jgi:hypothetical protein
MLSVCLMSTPLPAQWTKIPRTGIPRSSDGKPDLPGRALRLADGKAPSARTSKMPLARDQKTTYWPSGLQIREPYRASPKVKRVMASRCWS